MFVSAVSYSLTLDPNHLICLMRRHDVWPGIKRDSRSLDELRIMRCGLVEHFALACLACTI